MKNNMVVRFSYTIFHLSCLSHLMFGQANSVEYHHHEVDQSNDIGLFTIDDLRALYVGKKIPIYFPIRDPSLYPPFFPKHVVDAIPFSSSQIPDILRRFSLPSDSPKTNAVRETLAKCEMPAIEGEIKTCATSMESLLNFLTKRLEPGLEFKFITTRHPTLKTKILQNYTVLELPQEVLSAKKVPCHPMPYVYAVHYCHFEAKGTKAFTLPLIGDESGDRVDAIVVCHMDTSNWVSSHIAFRTLGIKPGETAVCHVFTEGNMVWVQPSSMASSV